MELAKGRDVVEAGIGAGVRDHHHAVPYQHSATIGHSRSPNVRNDRRLERDDISPKCHPALSPYLSMIFGQTKAFVRENRYPLFRIMLLVANFRGASNPNSPWRGHARTGRN